MDSMDIKYKEIVEAAGARYKGVVLGRPSFDNSFGSTLSLAPEALTVEAVRAAVAASDKLYSSETLHPLLRKFIK